MIAPEQQTVSLSEAAQALGIAPKTVRQRIKRGEIPASLSEGPHGPEYRVPVDALRQAETTPPRPPGEGPWVASPTGLPPAAGSGGVGEGSVHPDPLDSPALNASGRPSGTELSPDTATAARAEAAERERDRLAEEVCWLKAQVNHAQAAGEVSFLRDRLQQSHQAEEQLRILLGQAQRTIQEMAVRPALPPAPEEEEQPRRVRWWVPWRRG